MSSCGREARIHRNRTSSPYFGALLLVATFQYIDSANNAIFFPTYRQDAQIAGEATGAMSWAFVTALKKNPHQSYVQLLNSIRDELQGKYSQKPQLSSSHPLGKLLYHVSLLCTVVTPLTMTAAHSQTRIYFTSCRGIGGKIREKTSTIGLVERHLVRRFTMGASSGLEVKVWELLVGMCHIGFAISSSTMQVVLVRTAGMNIVMDTPGQRLKYRIPITHDPRDRSRGLEDDGFVMAWSQNIGPALYQNPCTIKCVIP